MQLLKSLFFLALVFAMSMTSFCQVPAYYNGVNFSLTGLALKNELADHITTTHNSPITYDEVWDVLKVADLDPTNNLEVLLIYGYNDADGSLFNDRTRDKNNNGGSGGQWNREHTFAKSLGSPDLGTSGPGSDAHNLRAADVDMNNMRGSSLFADGSGNAGAVTGGWYPGDEWKGDCARIVMYMYLRYGLQCRPYFCAEGTINSVDANMVNVLLEWNVEDPVSQLEKNRNDEIHDWQGNRNPFIDNPFIATRIWGGTPAEDTWGGLSTLEIEKEIMLVYPNPAVNGDFYISVSENIESICIYGTSGTLIYQNGSVMATSNYHITDVPQGVWMIQTTFENGSIGNYKIVVP